MKSFLVVGNRNSPHCHRHQSHLPCRNHHRRLSMKKVSFLVCPTLEKYEDRNAS